MSRRIAVLASLAASLSSAQQPPDPVRLLPAAVLYGRIADDATDHALDLVTVSIAGAATDLVTDVNGRFLVSMPAGRHLTLTITRLGYAPLTRIVDVPSGDTTRVDFFLVAVPATLDPVSVHARAAGGLSMAPGRLAAFEARRVRAIGGTFITRNDIERRQPVTTTDLLRGVAGIHVIDSAGTNLVASDRSHKPVNLRAPNTLKPCIMSIGVDGQIPRWSFNIDQIPPDDIHGIEIYSGTATVPREIIGARPDNACGLVMIWTRAT